MRRIACPILKRGNIQMNQNTLKEISHSSYMLLCAYVGLAWGSALGVIVFIGSFLSDDLDALLPDSLIAGMPTGLSLLFLLPALLGVLGVILGWCSYPVFSLLIRTTEGLKIQADIENPQTIHNTSPYVARARR